MNRIRSHSGFSLLEVVIAVGVLSLAVVALIGLTGPLMRQMSEDRAEGQIDQVVDALHLWVEQAAAADSKSLFSELRGGEIELCGYNLWLVDSSVQGKDEGWQIGEISKLDRINALANEQVFVKGPLAYYIVLTAGDGYKMHTTYVSVVARLWSSGVPEPDSNLSEWKARFGNQPVSLELKMVVR